MSYVMGGDGLVPYFVDDAVKVTMLEPQQRYPNKGTPCPDGLMKHVVADPSGRPITEFSLPAGRTKMNTWMSAYAGPRYLQTVLSNDPTWSAAVHAQRLVEWGVK